MAGNPKHSPAGSVAIELLTPIVVDATSYAKLTLRSPIVADQLEIERHDTLAMKELALIARLADVSLDVIKALSLHDYVRIQDAAQNFLLPPPPMTAAKRSSRSAGRRGGG